MADRNSELPNITANAHNIPDDSVDCGIRALGWCRGANCQKFARLRSFVVILAIAALFQGASESYFRVSAKQAAFENDYNPIIVDWLLVTSGLVQAVFAIFLAHWAHKTHPISWLGGSIMLQSALCVISIIPLIWNFFDNGPQKPPTVESNLCVRNLAMSASQRALSPEQNKVATLVMLFVLQFALGLGAMAFYTVGVTYIDDNSQSIDSPAVIATALAAKIFGLQIGSGLVLGVGFSNIGWWLGWAILAPVLFVSGLLLSLFPKRLPKTVIHQAAQRIIEESRHHQFGSQFSTYIDDTDFVPSVKRLFRNKLLIFNLLSIMFVQSAIFNYMSQEEVYLQSRFYLPFSEEDGLLQEWSTYFLAYFLKPPVAAIAMLVGGLVISKMKLSGRKITGINIGLGINMLLIYVAYIFVKCDVGPIASIRNGELIQPYCSRNCADICTQTTFQPVCVENTKETFFSPCYAGCTSQTNINNQVIYENCAWSSNDGQNCTNLRATNGACNSSQCGKMLIVFQVLSVTSAALLSVTVIGKIIITLRAVLPQDKALALALELMFVGLFAYIPVHLSYYVVTQKTCVYWKQSKCLLRETPKHGNILNILTAVLILASILFDVLVFIFIEGLNLYNCKVTDHNYTPSLYAPVPHDDTTPSNVHTILTTVGGSPTVTEHAPSPAEQRRESTPTRPAPKPIVNVFRNPSSLTTSSAGENSLEPGTNGVTYAQVVFPPDKRKKNDGTASPKRMAVRADVPLHHLSAEDVRGQLQNLKSFQSAETSFQSNDNKTKNSPIETNLDDVRPQSPETDF